MNSKSCLSATASSITITNEITTSTPDRDSQTNFASKLSQKETLKINKTIHTNNRKGSASSLNETSSETQATASETTYKKAFKQQEKSNVLSVHSNKGLRNFFGKLIRTSLVNINESNYNVNNETTIKQSITQNEDSQNKQPSTNSGKNNNNNMFRRGGTRATASARLQSSFSISNSSLLTQNCNEKITSSFFSFNLDTLAFSKLNSIQCYDWLCKNGFDCYFSKLSDGSYSNKWLKNGLHLLKASKYEYEKVKHS